MNKRIIIITQYYYPENFRINELASELVKLGYHVDVLTAIPNYPEGRYFEGYGIFRKRKEIICGVNVHRCFHFPRGKKNNLLLSINYLSFLITATLRVLCQFAWKKKYDAIIGFQMSPITQVVPGCVLGALRNTKVLTWVQDIWPDSIISATSKAQQKMLLPILSHITEFVYRMSDRLLISSPGMAKLICRNNDYSNKIEYLPNWSDDFLNCKLTKIPPMPKGFNLVMAGSINKGVGIKDLICFLEELKDYKDINIVFIGGGSKKGYLEEYAKNNYLTNVYFLGTFPYEMMPSFYAKADAMLLTLAKREEPHLDATIPSRLQSYMSAGKPIFAMIGSGASDVIRKAHCGLVAKPGDYKQLAHLLLSNYKNKPLLKELGLNARRAFEKEFTKQKGIKHFVNLIEASDNKRSIVPVTKYQ